MQASVFLLLLIIVFLVVISAFFSASEIGMMSLNRYRLRHLVKKNNKQAIRVHQMLSHPDRLLSVVLIGNTLANILASMFATLLGEQLYGDTGVFIFTLSLTLIILIFSEMTPKTFAAIYPQQVAFQCSFLLLILQKFLSPFIDAISFIAHGILRLMGISIDRTHKDSLTGEELRSVLHEAGGLLPLEHKSMLLSLLDLEQAKVEDIMIPIADVVGIDLDQSWQHTLKVLERAKHTRLPIYRSSMDALIGMVHLKHVLNLVLEQRLDEKNLLAITDAPYFIPEATSLNIQILNFQKMKRRSGFVVNEYGDLQGLVTMEDILEEIVGEFTTDIVDLSKDLEPQADGSIIVDAGMTVRNFNRLTNWLLPSIGPRTLSGLIIEYLGYIPPSSCCLRIESYQIEIIKATKNLVKSIRIIKLNKKKA